MRTAASYRLHALPGGPPSRAGLVRVEQDGAPIEVEIWAVPLPAYGSFVAGISRPLGLASVQLQDGSHVQGIVCEGHAAATARDITAHGGWRAYLATLKV
jgi:allophanate hydrolase